MAFAPKALCLVLVAVFCCQLSNGQSVSRRCECMNFAKKPTPWKNIEEFYITLPHARCKTTDIILTMKNTNKNTQRCVDPETNQGKILMQCWERKNATVTLKASECMQRK